MFSSEDGLAAEFFVDSKELVVLSEAVRSAWGASFDLACSEADNEVSDEVVFGLSGAVADHHTPSSFL